jgi:hypothetical protein
VDDPRSGHRLDNGADRLAIDLLDPARQRPQRVDVRGNSELVEVLSLIVQKTNVDLASTQIQSGVQH